MGLIFVRALEVLFGSLVIYLSLKVVDRENKQNTFPAALAVLFMISLARMIPWIGGLAGFGVWLAAVFGIYELTPRKAIGLFFVEMLVALVLAIPFVLLIMLTVGFHIEIM